MEDLSFVDIWALLLRRARVAVVGALLAFAGALLLYAGRPKLYTSTAAIEIGKVGLPLTPFDRSEPRLIEPAEAFAQRVRSIRPEGAEHIKATSFDPVITLSVDARSPEQARQALTRILEEATHPHIAAFASFKATSDEYASKLRSSIAQARSKLEALEKAGPTPANLTQQAWLADRLATLDRQEFEIQLLLAHSGRKPTQVLQQPSLPTQPSGPRLNLHLGLGLVAALAIGFLTAVMAELTAVARRRNRKA